MAEIPSHERRAHFRGTPRPGRRVELTYRRLAEEGSANPDGDGEEVRAVTRNIGVGGAYVLTPDPEPIGARLQIELKVPTSEQPIAVEAEVRWFIHPEKDPDGAGMGVKFIDIDVDALVRLSEYFASLTGAAAADGEEPEQQSDDGGAKQPVEADGGDAAKQPVEADGGDAAKQPVEAGEGEQER